MANNTTSDDDQDDNDGGAPPPPSPGATAEDERNKPRAAASTTTNKSKRSSIFARAKKSFARSDGNRGADVVTLRGTRGADFEGQGRIHRGVVTTPLCYTLLCCCFGVDIAAKKEEKKDRLMLIKGSFCFVYSDEDAPAPKYAIGLQYMRPELKQPAAHNLDHGRYHVLLEDNLGDVQYEMSFETEDVAKQFTSAVKKAAKKAETEQIRKRLGHEHLLTKRASVMYAQAVAQEKEKDQPEKPITTEEIIYNMPVTPL